MLFLALALAAATVATADSVTVGVTDTDTPADGYVGDAFGAAPAAYAQVLSDATGLVNRLGIATDSGIFEVVVTSNFDITDYGFSASEKRLTLQTGSSLSNSIAEIVIPADLLSGDIDVYVDGVPQDVSAKSSDTVTFLVLRFERNDGTGASGSDERGGDGARTIEIVGTITSVSDVTSPGADAGPDPGTVAAGGGSGSDGEMVGEGGGCLVATAAYGSEMSGHVQMLREVRDLKVAGTESGRAFLGLFNTVYYSFSPQVADHMRENQAFRSVVGAYLSPMLLSLQIMNNAQEGSEHQVVGYGVLVILINLGLYVAAPAVAAAVVVTRAACGSNPGNAPRRRHSRHALDAAH